MMNGYHNLPNPPKQGFGGLISKKSLGQNFLINPHVLDKIVSAAEISKNALILEIGPGTGLLTKKLAEKAQKVIAIEKDHRLIEPLRETFKNYPNVEIVEGDILKFETKNLQLTSRSKASGESSGSSVEVGQYTIVANIPYYITSNFLRTIFESASWRMAQPKLIVLTIQKEVAKRIIAKPPHTNLLALSVQYYTNPEVIAYISKNNFRPIPKVDSAIIKLKVKVKMQNVKEDEKLFKLMRTGFSEKRKQLVNNLAKLGYSKKRLLSFMESQMINLKARAEELSLEQWQRLLKYLDA